MFDLATSKTRLNITNTASDALLQTALDTALALAERFCDRLFTYKAETVKFYHFYGDTIFLPRYPVESIIASTGLPTQYKTHNRLGVIELHAPQQIEEASISYAGGYTVLPADLELAIWMLFDQIWALTPGGGAAVGSGGAAVSGQVISSISAPDVGTIRFDTGGSKSGSGAGAGSGAMGDLLPAMAVGILDTYRRVTC